MPPSSAPTRRSWHRPTTTRFSDELLLARIGTPPLLADVGVDLDLGPEPLSVLTDRDRFLDLVTYLLEELVGTGARAVVVRARRDGDGAIAAVSGAGCDESPGSAEPRRFLYGLCERAGGVLEGGGAAGTRGFAIRFAPVL